MDTSEAVIPFLNWNLCRGLHEIMSTCLDRCLKEFAEHYFDKVLNINLLQVHMLVLSASRCSEELTLSNGVLTTVQ